MKRSRSPNLPRPETWTALGAGLLALVCFAVHTSSDRKTDSVPEAKKASAPRAAEETERDVEEETRAKWEAWREKHRPSALDTSEERDAKRFQGRMRTLGTSPVEILPGGRDGGGLEVAAGPEDLVRFLRSGGHYSGPLPPKLRAQLAREPKEEGR